MSDVERPLQDVLDSMIRHSEENPTHGFNCACKDDYLREARRIVTPERLKELSRVTRVLER